MMLFDDSYQNNNRKTGGKTRVKEIQKVWVKKRTKWKNEVSSSNALVLTSDARFRRIVRHWLKLLYIHFDGG